MVTSLILWNIWEILTGFPAVFWGVILGSIFSLGGVILSNNASNRRLLEQLRHEREQKLKDNEYSIKKEIFLQAAETFSAGVNTAANLGNLQIPLADIMKPYTDRSFAIAKLQIVANERTLKASGEFYAELTSKILLLTGKRMELEFLQSEIKILSDQIDREIENRGKYVQMMTDYNLNRLVDQPKWGAIQAQYDFCTKNIESDTIERDKMQKTFIDMQIDFLKKCTIETSELARSVIPVTLEVRDEL